MHNQVLLLFLLRKNNNKHASEATYLKAFTSLVSPRALCFILETPTE